MQPAHDVIGIYYIGIQINYKFKGEKNKHNAELQQTAPGTKICPSYNIIEMHIFQTLYTCL